MYNVGRITDPFPDAAWKIRSYGGKILTSIRIWAVVKCARGAAPEPVFYRHD